MQQLQLDGVPQPIPRPAEDSVYEPIPQLRECCLYSLSHCAYQLPVSWRVCSGYDQHIGFLCQKFGYLFSSIAKIGQYYSAIYQQQQGQGRVSIINVCWRQYNSLNTSTDVSQQMHLEAKEPSRRPLSEISALFSQVPDSAVSDWFAHRDWLGINQIQAQRTALASGLEEMANNIGQLMQSANPLLIRTDQRKGILVVTDYEPISLFQSGHPKATLHQGDGNDLRVCEGWLSIVGRSPIGQAGIGFKEVINEAVDFSHLVYTRSQGGHPPGERFRSATQSYTPLGFG